MIRIIVATFIASLFSLSMSGCTEATKTTTTKETEISTPVGTTTITTKREVKTTGETPPTVPQ